MRVSVTAAMIQYPTEELRVHSVDLDDAAIAALLKFKSNKPPKIHLEASRIRVHARDRGRKGTEK